MYLCFFVCMLMAISAFCMPDDDPKANHTEVAITRDAFGMPRITGGQLQDIAQAIGRVQAQDRLGQIFFIVQVANGRAAQYFGADLLESDIMQHQLNYTDAEVQQQIDRFFTQRTTTVYQSYTAGLNAYVARVNATPALMPYELRSLGFGNAQPVPQFTLYDILRANQFILQQFSPSSIPTYQLDNFADLEVLLSNFGPQDARRIFHDIDPTSRQVQSQYTIVPHTRSRSLSAPEEDTLSVQTNAWPDASQAAAQEARHVVQRLHAMKKRRAKSGIPGLGSNGAAISAAKSTSGNPMIRIAPQPNFNQPSDFYQIRIEQNDVGWRGNYFTIPTFPVTPNGVFNTYGVGAQVGHLPSNDFLFEPAAHAVRTRTDIIQVFDEAPLELPIYRSTSGGWVLTHPLTPDTTTILTLRSVYIDKQLRALNTFIEAAFATSLAEFVDTLLNPAWQADILLLEGDYVDAANNIAVFHTGGWTQLRAQYDRRLSQGVLHNPAPPNHVYASEKIARAPLFDMNHPQGFYVGWNSLFRQGAAGASDTIDAVGINRMYWLDQYIRAFPTLSFDDLKNMGLRQYLANNNTAFDTEDPDEDADLFTILFKKRFFRAVKNHPTPERLQAVALLQDFAGDWFDGDLDHILNRADVSDQRILASVWLNAVAHTILNPYLAGTTREVATATAADPVPSLNPAGFDNALTGQGNTLSRIFLLAFDNTLFFPGWLDGQPAVDRVIVEALDFALQILGGFQAQPWGKGKRGRHQFNNVILGPVHGMLMSNVSGCVLVAEFTPTEIRMESILALGQSGEILGKPSGPPQFNPHSFDQQPLFSQLQLRANPPFGLTE
jgi:hypothetical protein